MPVAGPGSSYLIGLVGTGIGPSLTPALHEREAAELGLRYRYRRLDLDRLTLPPTAIGQLLATTSASGYRGLNITHPCKQLVLDHLDELTPEVEALGAANTVLFQGSRSTGHNTDVSGFAASFARGLPGAGTDRVVLLGAGGAGAAVAHALLGGGARLLHIFDADARRSRALAASLCARFGLQRARSGELRPDRAELGAALQIADGLVHATPTGMRAHPGSPIPAELLGAHHWVAELVYRPLDTELLATARALGCRVLDGGMMAVFQAADALRLFTGREPDPRRMLRHFAQLTEAPAHPEPVGEGLSAP